MSKKPSKLPSISKCITFVSSRFTVLPCNSVAYTLNILSSASSIAASGSSVEYSFATTAISWFDADIRSLLTKENIIYAVRPIIRQMLITPTAILNFLDFKIPSFFIVFSYLLLNFSFIISNCSDNNVVQKYNKIEFISEN